MHDKMEKELADATMMLELLEKQVFQSHRVKEMTQTARYDCERIKGGAKLSKRRTP